MSHATDNRPASEAPRGFESRLTSLSVTDGRPVDKPAEGPLRPSAFAIPTSTLIPEKLPTYTESQSTRGTKRKADLPASKPRPDPKNPFFDSRLDLKHGAGLIFKSLKAAHTSTTHWAGTMVESHFLQVVEKAKHNPDHALNRISKDVAHILELLRFGRKGWTLNDLPHNFFDDVEQLLPDIIMHLNKLSDYRGCGHLMEKVVFPIVEVEKKLKAVRRERVRIEKAAKAKEKQFWERDVQKLIKKENPGEAMERVFGFVPSGKKEEEKEGEVVAEEGVDEEIKEG